MVAASFGATGDDLVGRLHLDQLSGWSWGKFRRPSQAARFHLTMIICLVTGLWLLLTGIDPAKLPELGRVQRNRALPLTYLLILIVTDDSGYMGEHVNGTMLNRVGVLYLVILTIASVAAILLLVITGLAHASVPPAAIHLRAG